MVRMCSFANQKLYHVLITSERDDIRKERDELQKDVETICLQQAGVASSVDVSTRMQARRFIHR